MGKIKVMILQPSGLSEVQEIENSLKGLQNVVGGYIEIVPVKEFIERGIIMYCNDEGKFENLTPSLVFTHNGEMVDYIAGNALLCGSEGAYESSLTDEQIEFIKKFIMKDCIHRYVGFEEKGYLLPEIRV